MTKAEITDNTVSSDDLFNLQNCSLYNNTEFTMNCNSISNWFVLMEIYQCQILLQMEIQLVIIYLN